METQQVLQALKSKTLKVEVFAAAPFAAAAVTLGGGGGCSEALRGSGADSGFGTVEAGLLAMSTCNGKASLVGGGGFWATSFLSSVSFGFAGAGIGAKALGSCSFMQALPSGSSFPDPTSSAGHMPCLSKFGDLSGTGMNAATAASAS